MKCPEQTNLQRCGCLRLGGSGGRDWRMTAGEYRSFFSGWWKCSKKKFFFFFFGCTGSSLRRVGLSSCGTQALERMGSVVVARRLSCSMWDLISLTRDESRPRALGAWSLNQWTTREVPESVLKLTAQMSEYTKTEWIIHFLKNIYLFIWLRRVLVVELGIFVAVCGIFRCGAWASL